MHTIHMHRRRDANRARNVKLLQIGCSAACFIFAVTLAGAAQNSPPGGALRMDRVVIVTPINETPDANTQMLLHEQQVSHRNFAAANALRKKQISDDTATLIKLALDFKAEVEKTGSEASPAALIRQASDIETLAHNVKEKMKLTAGVN